MLARKVNRAGLCLMIGSSSSAGWMPVTFGLYSHSRMAWSTPSDSSRASNASGMTAPSLS